MLRDLQNDFSLINGLAEKNRVKSWDVFDFFEANVYDRASDAHNSSIRARLSARISNRCLRFRHGQCFFPLFLAILDCVNTSRMALFNSSREAFRKLTRSLLRSVDNPSIEDSSC